MTTAALQEKLPDVPWRSHVPPRWSIERLRYALSRNEGGVWGDEAEEGTLVLRSTEQTVDGQWKVDDPARCRLSAQDRASALLRKGDLVVTKSSGSELHIGKTTIVTDEIEQLGCCYSNFMQRLRPVQDWCPKYIYYILNNLIGREQLVYQSNTTTGLANLNGGMIGNILVPFPPLDEQQTIATFLDRKTATIDAVIAKKQRMIELLHQRRHTLISHAVTKGLNAGVPMRDSGVEWMGVVPRHWAVERIKRVARLESGHTPDKKVPEYWTNCDIPWVSLNDTGYLKDHDYIGETANYINALGIANSSARLLPARAVVFSRDATIGRCAITTKPMAVSQHFIAWLCGPRLHPEYLLLVLRSMTEELERLTFGATVKTIGMDDVSELVTPVPPLREQQEIVADVTRQVNRLDALVQTMAKQVERFREYRQAFISAAVTGRIDVGKEVA